MERQRRQKEAEQKTIEEQAAKRIEMLVKKRVEEELEKRRDEIEQEVNRRVDTAKAEMEREMMLELEKRREQIREDERRREVGARIQISLDDCCYHNTKIYHTHKIQQLPSIFNKTESESEYRYRNTHTYKPTAVANSRLDQILYTKLCSDVTYIRSLQHHLMAHCEYVSVSVCVCAHECVKSLLIYFIQMNCLRSLVLPD